MSRKKLFSKFKDGSAYFGFLDIDIKGKYQGCGGFCRYIFQSLAAGIFVAVMTSLLFLWQGNDAARYMILSSIGASAFLVFGAPGLATSKPLKVIFGHSIAVIVGGGVFFLREEIFGAGFVPTAFVVAALLSVSLATFFMIALSFEHPPATGTALALAIYTSHPSEHIFILVSFILVSAAVLGFIHHKRYKEDGFKAMTGIDSGTLKKFKQYRKQGENILLTIQDLAKAKPKDIYFALGGNSDGSTAKHFCHKKVEVNNFNDECCPIFQMWIDQAKGQIEKEKGYSRWTLRDLF
ncbi:MAG: HPP family protein [Thiotrichaceae bacterium]|nr:HPP family protein [Thiotrichaceae bacterium]